MVRQSFEIHEKRKFNFCSATDKTALGVGGDTIVLLCYCVTGPRKYGVSRRYFISSLYRNVIANYVLSVNDGHLWFTIHPHVEEYSVLSHGGTNSPTVGLDLENGGTCPRCSA